MHKISIGGEAIFHIFGLTVTNSLLLTFVMLIIFFTVGFTYDLRLKGLGTYSTQIPGNFVFFVRFVSHSLYALFESVLGEKTKVFYSILASFFLFILLSNWLGLIPGVGSILYGHEEKVPLLRAGTADLNTTIGLALIAFVIIQYFGIKYVGLSSYLNKFINLKNPMAFFTGILELISEFSKIISFAFRLFGNIFAGEVLLVIIATLIPVAVSLPFLLLELFVGAVQALVFSLLTAVFLNIAIAKEAH